MSKQEPFKCRTCGKQEVYWRDLVYITTQTYEGKDYTLCLRELRAMQCNDCLSVVLNDDANMLISKYLRLVAGLLQPMDIGFIRFVRGLTVEEMAEKLGITEQKMMRIENGLQIQDRSTDTLLRGLL